MGLFAIDFAPHTATFMTDHEQQSLGIVTPLRIASSCDTSAMRHILPASLQNPLPLHGSDSTRHIEQAVQAGLPPHTLMDRAAQAVFRLGRALYPHARHIWVACGPGNNGGDGLLAAAALQREGLRDVTVTWRGDESRLPDDARYALAQARAAGVTFADTPPAHPDLAIDALLGLGVRAAPQGAIAQDIERLRMLNCPVLSVDLPSGLHPDTGQWLAGNTRRSTAPRHTLTLLTLKPGLFTAEGRDVAGDIWLDDLGADASTAAPDAFLNAAAPDPTTRGQRHGAHKGLHGDLFILGGQNVASTGQGMTGAALLAARAGLFAGAGRVYVGLLDNTGPGNVSVDPVCPELMFREANELAQGPLAATGTTVCGCGGGTAVRSVLPHVLEQSPRLVLDADALNAIAGEPGWQQALKARSGRNQLTVLTPHPLEAARLLGTETSSIQANRLAACRQLSERFGCITVLKGSGSIVCAPGFKPAINATGNALLATAGTGDALAGLIGASLAIQPPTGGIRQAFELCCDAVYRHGLAATLWPADRPFSASLLAAATVPR